MSRRWLLSLLCLLLISLSFLQLSSARGEFKVNEARTRVLLQNNPVEVQLAVENSLAEITNATIRLELLDPRNGVASKIERTVSIGIGKQAISLSLPFDLTKLPQQERQFLPWYRLRYNITDTQPAAKIVADGIISLSLITPDLFSIRVAATELAREGIKYRARVQAIHPITQKPTAGVRVDAVLTLETDDQGNGVKLPASGVTDSSGYAILNFAVPARFPVYPHELQPAGGSIHVIAQRGALVVEAENQVLVDQFPRIVVSTDKPIYQPGQVLHVRALALSPTKYALANQTINFRVTDPGDTLVFKDSIKSTRFGVGSIDWQIPENMRLGDYLVRVSLGSGEYSDSSLTTVGVRISRYDLPNFSVTAKPDHAYYLPNQNAEVKVTAGYLFGQPVMRGKVRVVRETEREWNYREQKWDIEEGDKYEGETDADGRFTARIDLSADHADLEDASYRRFRDVTYAAYFTDLTTNRTEQRRFDLRVTRDPIHVYVIRKDAYRENNKLPLQFYVSTFYADGAPAECKVSLIPAADDDDDDDDKKTARPLATVRSNRYGLAKIARLRLPERDMDLKIVARDSQGKQGSDTEDFSNDDGEEIRVETGKSLYKPGDPITLDIASTVSDLTAVVDITRESSILISRRVRLHGGAASITIPYKSEFKDKLTIAAYADFAESSGMISTRTILFPRDQDLKVEAHATAKSYRPGDQAQLDLRIRTPGGGPAEAALGLVIVDKAVDERYRSDQEFGNRANGFYGSLGQLFDFDEQISGITLKDLQHIDMTKPVPPDLELAAEVLLNKSGNYYPVFFDSETYETSQAKVFGGHIKVQLAVVLAALDVRYNEDGQYPRTEASLKTILGKNGIDLGRFRDPWGTNYSAVFAIDGLSDVLSFRSAGADKQFGTDDDFSVESKSWAYFRPIGRAIDQAVLQYHQRTGGFIRDFATLRAEVAKAGSDLDSLRDRWDRPYRFDFDVAKTSFVINIWSGGPNKQFTPGPLYYGDDFKIWGSTIDYFAETRTQIDNALNTELKKNHNLPQSDTALGAALANSNVNLAALQDPWGTRFYSVFKIHSFYGDRVTIESRMKYGEAAQTRTNIKPTTLTAGVIELRSAGADRKEGTEDDFDVATFSGVLSEQASQDATPRTVAQTIGLLDDAGGIVGVVTDMNDAAVPGARILATNSQTSQKFETTSDDEGAYLLRNLPVGTYELLAEAVGFKRAVITNIPVASANITEVNFRLEAGAVTETVTVTSQAPSVQTTQASVSNNFILSGADVSTRSFRGKSKANIVTKSGTNADLVSTPRLREYFPETLLWQPLLETDNDGRAQLKFKLADNITTWRMSVIGSTADGQIGTADTEIKSFQPFFVEHDPPRVLTEGDQISLPIVLRNYLERTQAVDVEIKPESWFKLLGSARQRANVPAGDATRQTFELKAVASVKDGKQRITATTPEANDAIEKPVTVHPDGEEKTQTVSDVFSEAATLHVDLPGSVIAGSTQAELKIYPNLMAHVIESVEGILERPHGCAEQTISSAYPSLLVLRRNKQQAIESSVGNRAQRFADLGYQRLLNYRTEDGAFTYWGRGDADLALTAYALRFLHDAREFVNVDEEVIKSAREWLIKQQQSDGSWLARSYSSRPNENQHQTALVTAFVARVLALTEHAQAATRPAGETVSAELRRALAYLSTRSEEIDEPYLIASYALAAIDAGDLPAATRATDRLRALAHTEGGTTYWALETNTPFYGWGLAGRVETSALAVQALARLAKTKTGRAAVTTEPLVRSGLLFLLRQKDRYGVWYSTQATINVLDTLVTFLNTEDGGGAMQSSAAPAPVEIIVNGQRAALLELPPSDQTSALVRIDISRFLRNGVNQVELRRASGSAVASAQLVTNYYVPWPESPAPQTTGLKTGDSSSLRLTTTFDKNTARINEEISCHVKAERFGFSGYGMLLAEIGLPPGADVDRASLETAMKASDWTFSQYDVLPDRVVVYLWPRAGGIDFDFKFRPRFALTAKAAPAVVYDYYNPDARAVVAPATFVIR